MLKNPTRAAGLIITSPLQPVQHSGSAKLLLLLLLVAKPLIWQRISR